MSVYSISDFWGEVLDHLDEVVRLLLTDEVIEEHDVAQVRTMVRLAQKQARIARARSKDGEQLSPPRSEDRAPA